MKDHEINTDRPQSPRDKRNAGFMITVASIVFGVLAWIYWKDSDPLKQHTSWLFGITSVFLFVIGVEVFVKGLIGISRSRTGDSQQRTDH